MFIHTPDRQRTERFCHVNMLKRYLEREDAAKVAIITSVCLGESVKESEDPVPADDVTMSNSRLQNSNVLANLGEKLCHLSEP